ncbi:alpha/beta hydrolase fold-domain-containing protein [Lasiosphaeria miniovina]|uniref:Alpha/beta hydrolase fold-domain-containing protein n=1 Tax=Lasiosphaeria miniovina TaxID=1954250 RepID=A0AA40A5U8_9PEZI|nr:alpha/beta hydrolase fold-domain-containing protein [Lasiosphaeria miniovina]KAK0709741.1 alpha/beta hydrolase fold-domain-containing protein [Lasiosphaeria miniovina]
MVQLSIILAVLSKVPLASKVALLHMLRMSEASKYQTLRVELSVAVIRSFLAATPAPSMTTLQSFFAIDIPVKGKIWISKYSVPVPAESDVAGAVARAIDGLSTPEIAKMDRSRMPEPVPVAAEWTGYRANAKDDSDPPALPEKELYAEMMKEVKTPVTVLYFHGGAYCIMEPSNYRPLNQKLAKLTGGRCYSVSYRLAPQNPFPAALMDALSSYLGLLYPAPDAFHEPVRPEHIVLCGDSAGAHLSMALVQTLLELKRQGAQVLWQGQQRDVPLPAGMAMNSPWADITVSSPSCKSNAAFDYLPTLEQQVDVEAGRPACAAWPANPPRTTMYAEDRLVMHPLVSPLLAPAGSWAGAPPAYICTGWELVADEDKLTATRLHEDGVPVVFEEYEAMPHIFAVVFPDIDVTRRCMDGWAGFINRVVEAPAAVRSSFVTIKAKTLAEVDLDPDTLAPYDLDYFRERVKVRLQMGWVRDSGLGLVKA